MATGWRKHLTDTDLVRRLQAGDLEAFEVLHDRYYARLYRLAYLKTGNAEDAKDIAAETFVRALSAVAGFRFRGASGSVYPWLHRIAVNLIIDSGRERPTGGTVSLDASGIDSLHSLLDSLPDTTPSLQEQVERQELQALVRSCIASLPGDQGEAVLFRFLGEMPLKEIAATMGRSEGAIKSLLHRAICNLRDELGRRARDAELRLRFSRTETEQGATDGQTVHHAAGPGPGGGAGPLPREPDGGA